MEIIVKLVINFVFFPIVILGLISVVPLCYSLKRMITRRVISEQEKKMVMETILISVCIILLLIIVRWLLPNILPTELLQNICPKNQYVVAIIGKSTFEIYSLLFYCILFGFVHKIKQVQYRMLSKDYFVRRSLLPMLGISLLCTFIPYFFGV
ncbi:hypothetical protein IGI67_001556 [Enterococcus sp. AZ196]